MACYQPAAQYTTSMMNQNGGQMGYPTMPQAAYPVLPSGIPTGPSPTPVAPPGQQAPQTIQSPLYTPGFLRTQIGKKVRVEFLIGTGTLVDRSGTLIGVGTSYILLQLVESDDVMMCDIYSIKFVTFLL